MEDKKINICHIISGDLWAGAEVMVHNLVVELRKRKECNVAIIILNNGKMAKTLIESGMRVYVVDENMNSTMQIVKKVFSILKMERISVIHSHRYKENLIAVVTSIFSKRKIISTIHGLPESINKNKFSKMRIILAINFFCLSKIFTKVISVSEEIRDQCERSNIIQPKKIVTIHNGIPISRPAQIRKRSVPFTIGSAGRLTPIKNYKFLIDVANYLKEYPIHIKIAGDGIEKDYLTKRIKDLKLTKNISLLGNVCDMEGFYESIDLYVNCSLHEGIPISILEAMSHKLPIVASDVGGIPEIINNGENGFLVTSGDAEKFASICLRLYEDKLLYQSISECAFKTVVNKFSIEVSAEKHLLLYKEVLGKRAE